MLGSEKGSCSLFVVVVTVYSSALLGESFSLQCQQCAKERKCWFGIKRYGQGRERNEKRTGYLCGVKVGVRWYQHETSWQSIQDARREICVWQMKLCTTNLVFLQRERECEVEKSKLATCKLES
ncbi:hypothetical protein GGS20DRAFT_230390 [Poronia punctata]|nr:hypothetical protein GGS20DRAFT_230390 [Poronia punctata]